MRRLLILLSACAITLLPLGRIATLRAAPIAASLPGVGKTVIVQGFAVTVMSVTRAREAGPADYIPGKGNLFLFVTVRIVRHGATESYFASPLDFQIQTSRGDVIDSEQFGVAKEFGSWNVGRTAVTGMLGFEVPAHDAHLQLLWQPALASNPDAQAVWAIGMAGKTIQYLQ
jgi:Domain of unknown function (DUF4352)